MHGQSEDQVCPRITVFQVRDQVVDQPMRTRWIGTGQGMCQWHRDTMTIIIVSPLSADASQHRAGQLTHSLNSSQLLYFCVATVSRRIKIYIQIRPSQRRTWRTSEFVESSRSSSDLAVGSFARDLLRRGAARPAAIHRRLEHLSAPQPCARTTPRVAVAPRAPLRSQHAVHRCQPAGP